jgi:hypothetical protein
MNPSLELSANIIFELPHIFYFPSDDYLVNLQRVTDFFSLYRLMIVRNISVYANKESFKWQ